MRRTALVLAALLACAAPLAAQDTRTTTPSPEVRRTAVVFTLQGRLGGIASPSALPAPLVERLSREPALATLTIGAPAGAQDAVVARFVFGDEAAFRAWYGRAETRELFRATEAALLQTTFAFTLKRYPAASLAEAASATP